MTHPVHIEPFGVTVQVDTGQTILEAALESGVDYPFACQQGQCGSCKSFLLDGNVEMGTRYNLLACTGEERSRGMILACQSQPLSECRVSVVEIGGEIVHSVRDLVCKVASVEQAAGGVSITRLEVLEGGPFNFAAGQYATLWFDDLAPFDCAMASRPEQRVLEFHLSRAGPAVGEQVALKGPLGRAYLHDEHLGPILAVAGGAGLGAMLCIVETALASGMRQPMRLLHEGPVYCLDRLQGLAERHANFTFDTVAAGAAQHIAGDLSAFHGYVAGPGEMCSTARRAMLAAGMADENCLINEART